MPHASVAIRSIRSVSVALVLASLLGACTPANIAPTFDVAQGDYARAFEASVETLREYRFTIDRIDAAAGVVSTESKASSGLATPWDVEQSTPTQEVEDLLAFNSRVVRVTFEPRAWSQTTNPPEIEADQFSAGPMVGRVDAVISRRYVRGWRVSPMAILLSDFTYDTQAGAKGQPQQFDAPLTRDERLAARIASRIRERLSQDSEASLSQDVAR